MFNNDILLALSFTLAFICLVAVFFTDKKILFSVATILLFAYFYMSNYQNGSADAVTILTFISGCLLLSLELFIPSFGIIGFVGAVLTIRSVFDALDNNGTSIILLLSSAAAILITVTIFVRLGFSAKLFDKSILKNGQSFEKGYSSKKDLSYLVGKTATTKTILRPTGVITIDDSSYDAKTNGEFIQKDKKVKIKSFTDGHLVVESIKEK